jgi:hypothetical protein
MQKFTVENERQRRLNLCYKCELFSAAVLLGPSNNFVFRIPKRAGGCQKSADGKANTTRDFLTAAFCSNYFQLKNRIPAKLHFRRIISNF